MSRIGNKAIAVPKGVELSVADGSLSVNGPKGTLTRPLPPKIDRRGTGWHYVARVQPQERCKDNPRAA